jgi:formamidopyrimidine-DNA glycosylase
MPELPEVQTIVRDLAPLVTGRRITQVQVLDPLLVRFPDREEFARRLTGTKITEISRRGKYIVISTDEELTWLIHLRMTGRLTPNLDAGERHLRASFTLEDGQIIYYCDLRRFGDMWAWYPGEDARLGGYALLGPEPLHQDFCPTWFGQVLKQRKAPIKGLLLDQKVVAGLGNIYVDEALFLAGIDPRRTGSSLTEEEQARLCQAVRGVLGNAIEARGTTFRDYRTGLGDSGGFQFSLNVYGRGGQDCRACGGELSRERIAGRTTVWCSRCQS